jgi:glycosyltransferase involved in cell wall biosynthesis
VAEIRNIHQMQVAAATENSIGNEVIELQAALRRWGYRSEIYAEQIAPSMRGRARHFGRYRPSSQDLIILHYSTGSTLTDYLYNLQIPLVLLYHNVTPPAFLTGIGSGEKERARRGREALEGFREQTVLAIGRSAYSRAELAELGFQDPQVLPVIVSDELFLTSPDTGVLARLGDDEATNLLFVGRIVPNKRQEDLIKLLYFYRQINPHARLLLVGSWSSARRYADWLRRLAQRLGLADAVHFCGHVSISELAAYYRLAHVFVSMSEHEGFGIPLVEAMRFGVPIVAYASTAVPETLGDAGILTTRKDYPVIAETVHLLHTDVAFRSRIVARQHRRARSFEREAIIADFRRLLDLTLQRFAVASCER